MTDNMMTKEDIEALCGFLKVIGLVLAIVSAGFAWGIWVALFMIGLALTWVGHKVAVNWYLF